MNSKPKAQRLDIVKIHVVKALTENVKNARDKSMKKKDLAQWIIGAICTIGFASGIAYFLYEFSQMP